jgi:hypothetical protein
MIDQSFSTNNTQLAAYIIAANLLHYLRAELREQRVEFLFDDPQDIGKDIQRSWVTGLVSLVNPKVLLETRNKLIDEIKRLKG